MSANATSGLASASDPYTLTNCAREVADFFRRSMTSLELVLAISNPVTKGCAACAARLEARPSRKKPPVALPSTIENGGVKDAYTSDGALRNPGRLMSAPPSGADRPSVDV